MVIRELIKNYFQFGGLMETRVKEGKAENIVSAVFQVLSFMSIYEYNLLGRI